MPLKPPNHFAKPVRQTLNWLVEEQLTQQPQKASGEAQYLLFHAQRLHESLRRLPERSGEGRCLVVGSWGLEAPYLMGQLGWEELVCICAPGSRGSGGRRQIRRHPNAEATFEFDLIGFDIESGPWPFESESFDLVVFWGCFEHLRDDPEFALYELNRVCRLGGMVSLVTDNAISFQATHSLLRGFPMPMRLHSPASEGHWRLYTPWEVRELLTGTGWQVDLLTSIVPDPPVYWRWWKRWLFKRWVGGFRRGFGLSDPYWNAFILAHAVKSGPPTRGFPAWLYKDEKVRQLKVRMMDMLDERSHERISA